MKPHLIFLFLICAGWRCFAIDGRPEEFQATLCSALTSGNRTEIDACFYWADTPAALREVIAGNLREATKGRTVLDVYLFDPADKRVNRNIITAFCSGTIHDGQHYPPNLELKYLAAISLRSMATPEDSGAVYWVGVGRTPEGRLCIPGTRVQPDREAGRSESGIR